MPKLQSGLEYVSNNSFMTSQVKVPNPFGGDYEDPLEALKARIKEKPSTETDSTPSIVSDDKQEKTGLTELTELTNLTELTRPIKKHPISPERDFTKTPNSIGRHVMAKGLFKGKSKQIYDYLWTASRGSITPVRTIRKTHGEIQEGSGIGSLNTVKNGLKYLQQIGLINKTSAVGEASGNIYEIFTPEEVNLTSIDRPDRPVSSVSPVRQELVEPVRPEIGRTNLTQVPLESINYNDVKTSLKTNTIIDDDALAKFAAQMNEASRKLTKRGLKKDEEGKWEELAELLVMELEIAAARTKSVSNVPAFLTEHLRRRLLGKSASTKSAEVKSKTSKPLKVGKSSGTESAEEYQAEPLSKEGRKTVLKTMREYLDKGQNEFIMSFQDSYTQEDWDWLTQELKQENSSKHP
jgi:hypothetical protein